jgi:Zn finger protein HypA/HybF involved in hydrogenase expression
MKTFWFTCRDCHRRKQVKHESIRPGLCSKCYNKRFEIDERESKGEAL